ATGGDVERQLHPRPRPVGVLPARSPTGLEADLDLVQRDAHPRRNAQRVPLDTSHPANPTGARHPKLQSDRARSGHDLTAASRRSLSYSIRRPEMARPITSCWICSVPSKMSKIFEGPPEMPANKRFPEAVRCPGPRRSGGLDEPECANRADPDGR